MKVCSICGEVYPEQALACQAHDDALVDWSETTDAHTHTHTGLVTDVALSPVGQESPFEIGHTAGEIDLSTPGRRSDRRDGGLTPPVEIGSRPRHRGPLRSGRALGNRYVLGKHIGVGGYGAVFDAKDQVADKRVAVKVLSPAAAESAEMLTRFHREAIAASRVEHPHIVEVLDFDVDDGTHFLVMEYLGGVDLAEVLDNAQTLVPERALFIIAQCASALAAAHRAGILHRDIKPSNIFLVNGARYADYVKIIDFGISKLTRAAGNYSDLTSASKVVGTPCYMSPEQARGDALDGRIDVYALGIILFEMLTGERPFVGKSSIDILTKHIEAKRVPPSNLRPELAAVAGLDALVLRAIAARPTERYPSMTEFGTAILQCLEAVSPGASAPLFGAANPGGKPISPFAPVSSEVTRVQSAVPKRRSAALLGVAVAAVAAVAGGVIYVQRGGAQDMPTAQSNPTATRVVAADSTDPVASKPQAERAVEPSRQASPVVVARPATPVVPTAVDREQAAAGEDVRNQEARVRRVRLTSSPGGATVFRGDEELGATPLFVVFEAGVQEQTLSIRARGYSSRVVSLRPDRDAFEVTLKKMPREKRPAVKPDLGVKEW